MITAANDYVPGFNALEVGVATKAVPKRPRIQHGCGNAASNYLPRRLIKARVTSRKYKLLDRKSTMSTTMCLRHASLLLNT